MKIKTLAILFCVGAGLLGVGSKPAFAAPDSLVRNYEIEGMTCKACVKAIKKGVCEKLKEKTKSCEVQVGSMKLEFSSAESVVSEAQLKSLVSESGDFKLLSSK